MDLKRISAETKREAPPAGAKWPGRPPVHTEDWSKVTVVLLNRQIVFLDRLASDVRAATGAVLKRAEIIRALVDNLAQSGLDVSSVRSQAELRAKIVGLRALP
jgi:hypothetical protein